MNAHTSSFFPTAEAKLQPPAALSARWAALRDAGAAVGALAGLAAERPGDELDSFPATIGEANNPRYQLAERALGDLAAVMQPGLEALLSVHARGQDPTAAALALWREYHAARSAVLALVPPNTCE